MVLRYFDGSGNGYIIVEGEQITIEYAPVKPEMSSSGLYDGGDSVKKQISREEYDELFELFNAALHNFQDHIEKRIMGSGLVNTLSGELKKTCILKPNSHSQLKLEAVLKRITRN